MGISTQVLDTTKGRPGAGVNVTLELMDGEFWEEVATAKTDAEGRALLTETPAAAGVYRLSFDTAGYYKKQKVKGLFPIVEIAFTAAKGEKHIHLPLLLTENGYTVYRGA
jgi:5-hydroxyisourate hydrolase